jgi:acylglycerol lipase
MRHSEDTFRAFDGETIHHQRWLPDGDARAAIILVHGLGEHAGRYQHVAAALVDAGYGVFALDHRGHGKSSGKRAFVKDYDELMHDLTQFRRLVAAEHPDLPVILLGHSMGGNLVMGHVLGNQEGLAGIVLSGPALQIGDDFSPLQLTVFSMLAKVAPGLRPQALSADAISRDADVVAAYRNDPLVYTGKISAGLGAALIGAMQSFPDRYPELRLPVLLLHGTDDQLADIRGSKALEAAATNADVTAHYYEGLYHEVFNEPEREQVIADLVRWLDDVVS